MAGLVLDSSIALSWCLPDEAAPDLDEVRTLVMRPGGGHVPPFASSLAPVCFRWRVNDADSLHPDTLIRHQSCSPPLRNT
jgi:hypothetical protein